MAICSSHHLEGIGVAVDPASCVHRLDPRAKLIGLATVTIVAVSTPVEHWPVYAVCAGMLTLLALGARVPAGQVLRRASIGLRLVILTAVFLPFARPGGPHYDLGPIAISLEGISASLELVAKASIGTASAVLLAATTAYSDVLRGLEAMRVPKLVVAIAAFMYRYLFVISDEVRRMRAALASRGYRPRHLLQAGTLGRIVTVLFLRAHARGERVYLAMAARGYRGGGALPTLRQLRFGRVDALFVAVLAAGALGARVAVEIL